MEDKAMLSRRTLLYASAATAGAAVLGACSDSQSASSDTGGGGDGGNAAASKGSKAKPLSAPKKLNEAPMLTEMVKAGKLPPIGERVPEHPYVIPHNWTKPGKFGGEIMMVSPKPTGGPTDASVKEYMYGHSPLRWLNDGMDIGPGLVESWESNDDASKWTLHFRKGLRWSDGHPWSTADIMFWWNDLVLNEEHSDVPPDEARSGKGTLAKFEAPDDTTLVLTFDAPAPLTADRLAMWVNGTVGNGPKWMAPRHYAKQFHPKYNKDVPDDWASAGGLFEQKVDWSRNPNCPTMTGWKLKSLAEGRVLSLERNPYYYAVMPNGDQLPYADTVTFSMVQDAQVGKLGMQQGKYDHVMGQFNQVGLSDISGMKRSKSRSHLDVLLWDGGSGTGSIFFLNYDHKDEAFRKLIREPAFRQALSLGVNRKEIQKAIYFNTGEISTGTMSPKAIEFHVDDQGKQAFQDWRGAYLKHDPEKAGKLLDELGVVDKNGDGFREMPDGSKLRITLDYPANTSDEHKQKNNYLVKHWKAIGIEARPNPIPPEAFTDRWQRGQLSTQTAWEVGDGPNCLVYPQWIVPIGAERWAPLEGQTYALRGTAQEGTEKNVDPFKRTPPRMDAAKGGPVEQLWEIYDRSKVQPDEMARHKLVWDITKIHVEHGPFFMGTVSNTPQVVLNHTGLANVPRKGNLRQGGFANPWIHPTPAVYDPEAYYWEDAGRRQ